MGCTSPGGRRSSWRGPGYSDERNSCHAIGRETRGNCDLRAIALPTLPGSRLFDGFVQPRDGLLNSAGYTVQRLLRAVVFVLVERYARILQGLASRIDCGAGPLNDAAGQPRNIGIAEPLTRLRKSRGCFGHRALDIAPRAGPGVHRGFRSALRLLPAVDGVTERAAVIALSDRVFGTSQGLDRGGELGWRIRLGACGFRGVDGALRLVHLFAWWLGARRGQRDRKRHGEETAMHREWSIRVLNLGIGRFGDLEIWDLEIWDWETEMWRFSCSMKSKYHA